MNKHLQRVLALLKPKASSLGFSTEELTNVANDICNGLNISDDATAETIDAEINTKIDAALPMLRLAQSVANRVINNHRQQAQQQQSQQQQSQQQQQQSQQQQQDPMQQMLQQILNRLDKQDESIAAFAQQRVADARLAKLKKAVEGTGNYGDFVLSSYASQKFDNDDAFETYLTGVNSLAAEFKKGVKATETLAQPPLIPASFQGETITDNEVTEIAEFIY